MYQGVDFICQFAIGDTDLEKQHLEFRSGQMRQSYRINWEPAERLSGSIGGRPHGSNRAMRQPCAAILAKSVLDGGNELLRKIQLLRQG